MLVNFNGIKQNVTNSKQISILKIFKTEKNMQQNLFTIVAMRLLPVLRHTSSQVICSTQTDFVWSQYRKVVPSQISWCLTEEEEKEAKKEEKKKTQQNSRCGAHKSNISSHGIIFHLFSPF